EGELAGLRRAIEARGMAVSSVYSRRQWYFPISSPDPAVREQGRALVERLAWAASILGSDAVLVLPGSVDNSLFAPEPEIVPYDVAYYNARDTLRALARSAGERYRVSLALENVWNKFLLSPLEMAR